MKITCGIIEDEPLGRKLLERYISRVSNLELKWTKESVEDLGSMDTEHLDLVDIVFLDLYYMDSPETGPYSNLESCQAIENFSNIIITTAYPEQFIKSLPFTYIGMLNKPITYANFIKTIEEALSIINTKQQK